MGFSYKRLVLLVGLVVNIYMLVISGSHFIVPSRPNSHFLFFSYIFNSNSHNVVHVAGRNNISWRRDKTLISEVKI